MACQIGHSLFQPCVAKAEHLLSSHAAFCIWKLLPHDQCSPDGSGRKPSTLLKFSPSKSLLRIMSILPPHVSSVQELFLLFLLFCLGNPPAVHSQWAHLFYLHLLATGSFSLADIQCLGIFFSVILAAL